MTRFFYALVVLLALAGCGSPEDALIGKWQMALRMNSPAGGSQEQAYADAIISDRLKGIMVEIKKESIIIGGSAQRIVRWEKQDGKIIAYGETGEGAVYAVKDADTITQDIPGGHGTVEYTRIKD